MITNWPFYFTMASHWPQIDLAKIPKCPHTYLKTRPQDLKIDLFNDLKNDLKNDLQIELQMRSQSPNDLFNDLFHELKLTSKMTSKLTSKWGQKVASQTLSDSLCAVRVSLCCCCSRVSRVTWKKNVYKNAPKSKCEKKGLLNPFHPI